MRLIGIIIVVLLTIVGLYHFGWLTPEAEQRVEKGFEAMEDMGILDRSIREIGEGTLETVRSAIGELDEFELRALLDKVKNREIDMGELGKEELERIIEEELGDQPAQR